MKIILKYLDKIPKNMLLLIAVIIDLILGYFNYITGYDLNVTIFYLLPTVMVVWYGRRKHAVIIASLSAMTWLFADMFSGHVYANSTIPVWNTVMLLGFFLIVVYSLAAIKKLLETEVNVKSRFCDRGFKL